MTKEKQRSSILSSGGSVEGAPSPPKKLFALPEENTWIKHFSGDFSVEVHCLPRLMNKKY
jgi:hypothetical protein